MGHEPGAVLKQLVKLPKNPAACWEWLGQVNSSGVPIKQANGKPMAARRWMWEQLFSIVPPGLEIFGTCGTITCVNPHHLQCGHPHDRMQNGPLANLTPGDVMEIKRAKYAGPYEKTALAMKFGVTRRTLNDIWSERSWKQVSR